VKKILPTSAKAYRLKIFTLNLKDCLTVRRRATWAWYEMVNLCNRQIMENKNICNMVGIRNPVICTGFPHPPPSHLHWIEQQTDLRSCQFLFWSVISVVMLSRADDKESVKSTPTRPLQIALVNKNTQNTHCFMRHKTEYKLQEYTKHTLFHETQDGIQATRIHKTHTVS